MAYTHVSRLTTTSDSAFETLEAWLEAHGECGQYSESIISWSATLDEDGTSITRTAVWPMKAIRDLERAERPPNDKFNAIVISEVED